MPNTVATLADLRGVLIWVATFGKLLTQKGVLDKADIIQELNAVISGLPAPDPAFVSKLKT